MTEQPQEAQPQPGSWFSRKRTITNSTFLIGGLTLILATSLGYVAGRYDSRPQAPSVAQAPQQPANPVKYDSSASTASVPARDSAAGQANSTSRITTSRAAGMDLSAVYTGSHCLPKFSATDSVYVVKKGDTPWAIACGLLGRGATIAQIDSTLRAVQENNVGVFGADDVVVNSAGKLVPGEDGLYDHIDIGARVALRKPSAVQQQAVAVAAPTRYETPLPVSPLALDTARAAYSIAQKIHATKIDPFLYTRPAPYTLSPANVPEQRIFRTFYSLPVH